MTHLTHAEIVDAVDGVLAAERARHLEGCDACRRQLAALREALDAVQPGAGVPEPSPLFWDHFSRRVREAVDADAAAGRRSGWLRTPVLGWAVATVAIVLAAALVIGTVNRSRDEPAATPSPAGADAVPAERARDAADRAGAEPLDLDDDAEWALVRIVADDLPLDAASAAGLRAQPGSAERVALEMSAAERAELARLLEEELKRAGA